MKFRRLIGRLIEWFLDYEHIVHCNFYGGGKLPKTGYEDDAGYDLFVSKDMSIPPKSVVDVPSSLLIDPKEKIWFEIKARSSTFKKRGLEVQDAVIDRGYRGEMFAIIYNPTGNMVNIKANERICQIVPHRIVKCKFKFDKLSMSDRGKGGFGSSGR